MLDKILAAAFMLASPSPAEAPPPPISTIELPIPPKYQGDADVRVKLVHPMVVEWYCSDGKYVPDKIIFACYDIDKDLLYMPNPCAYPEADVVGSYAHLFCHEKAHKNGWRH